MRYKIWDIIDFLSEIWGYINQVKKIPFICLWKCYIYKYICIYTCKYYVKYYVFSLAGSSIILFPCPSVIFQFLFPFHI